MPFAPDTIAALTTPPGTAALALLRVSGPRAAALTGEIFGTTPPPRSVQHADYRDQAGRLVDDVLFTRFAGPHSYTGEDSLEISCHGSPFIAQKILGDLLARGCRSAEAGEFTKRAFLNGRLDLSQAEAVMDLIHARSERALTAANQQLRGALGQRMNRLIGVTVECLATIEAYIDFPEEDLPPENRAQLQAKVRALAEDTARLLATNRYGELLRSGIKTVILGEPNAGKSSLLNQLVGRDRALVSAEPGTTRDYIEEPISVGPHLLRLIDTAGLNPTPGALERRGMAKTLEQAEAADLYLWVLDRTRPLPALPAALLERLTPQNTVVVFNKLDLAADELPGLPQPFPVVHVSALLGAGLEALQAAIVQRAESLRTDVGEEIIAVNARHAAALETARTSLADVLDKLRGSAPTELVASDLRCALDAFGQIAGRVDNERVLDQLFASFCIGK